MALKNTIDPVHAQAALTAWLARQLPDEAGHRVSDVRIPADSGISAETVLFDAEWSKAGVTHSRGFVARVQPETGGVFPHCDLEPEFRTMQVLGTKTDIPVPEALWLERDAGVLGAPFLVMEKLTGRVPQDDPPFTATGWLLELSHDDQHTLYDNGLRAMSALATLDVEALGFGFLADTEMGAATVAANVDKWRAFFDWSRDGEPNPVIEAGFDWLDTHGAPEPERLALSWGDARLGNIMFDDDLSVAGLLDWELASLSSPEADLGWWLFLLRHHTEGIGLPMPAGFPDAATTITRWQKLTGLTAHNLDYFEVYAAVRLAVAMVRAAKMMIANGQLPPDAPMALTNPAVQLLGTILGLSAAALETQTFIGNR